MSECSLYNLNAVLPIVTSCSILDKYYVGELLMLLPIATSCSILDKYYVGELIDNEFPVFPEMG